MSDLMATPPKLKTRPVYRRGAIIECVTFVHVRSLHNGGGGVDYVPHWDVEPSAFPDKMKDQFGVEHDWWFILPKGDAIYSEPHLPTKEEASAKDAEAS